MVSRIEGPSKISFEETIEMLLDKTWHFLSGLDMDKGFNKNFNNSFERAYLHCYNQIYYNKKDLKAWVKKYVKEGIKKGVNISSENLSVGVIEDSSFALVSVLDEMSGILESKRPAENFYKNAGIVNLFMRDIRGYMLRSFGFEDAIGLVADKFFISHDSLRFEYMKKIVGYRLNCIKIGQGNFDEDSMDVLVFLFNDKDAGVFIRNELLGALKNWRKSTRAFMKKDTYDKKVMEFFDKILSDKGIILGLSKKYNILNKLGFDFDRIFPKA